MTQHQMPEQEFRCPSCGDRVKTRHWAAVCSKDGCSWRNMVPVIQEDEPKKLNRRTVFVIAVISLTFFMLVIARIVQEVF